MIDKVILEKYYYQDRLSMMEIALRLSVSHHAVVWWMNKHNLPRRTHGEAVYVKSNSQGDPFLIRNELNEEELLLKGVALGLYWGEGTKADLRSIRLANSDPHLISTFIKFLTQICQLKPEKICYDLRIFHENEKEEAIRYWQRKLNLSTSQFQPHVYIYPRVGKGIYRVKKPHGTLTVIVHNKKLRNWLIKQIQSLVPTATPATLAQR